MSDKQIAEEFKKILETEAEKLGHLAGFPENANVIMDVRFGDSILYIPFAEGIREAMKQEVKNGIIAQDQADNASEVNSIKKAIQDTNAQILSSGSIGSISLSNFNVKSIKAGRFLVRAPASGRQKGILVRFIRSGKGSTSDKQITDLAKEYRETVYNNWYNDIKKTLFAKDVGSSTFKKANKAITSKRSEVAHEESTTKGALAVKIIRDLRPAIKMPLNITSTDIASAITDDLNLTFSRNARKSKSIGKYVYDWYVEARLGKNFAGSEPTDVSSMKGTSPIFTEDKVQKAVNTVIRKKYPNTWWLYKLRGSPTVSEEVTSDMVLDLLAPLTKSGKPDMRFKANKLKKFKKKRTKKSPIKKSKRLKTTVQSGTVLLAAANQGKRRPQKEQREDTQNTQKLKSLINKRLPAQVRRNMGRPALINQTGIFSNSAELVSLRKTKSGLSGEYTYMRTGGGTSKNRGGVYETFENTGKYRWPAGYNPKPLISKSIRDLALQYTEQKLVSLRRV